MNRFFLCAWVPGIFIQVAFFTAGCLNEINEENKYDFIPLSKMEKPSNCLLVKLITDPAVKGKSYKSVGIIQWIVSKKSCFKQNEKILVYFPACINPQRFTSGTVIILKGKLRPIENQIKSGFDYVSYCSLRHIHAQVFLKGNQFDVIDSAKNSMYDPFHKLRDKWVSIIKNQIPDRQAGGLLEALMVGFTEDLDPGILKSYADAGVIHIIAISGLHLALICHILQLLLGKRERGSTRKWISLFAITSCLWAYSLLSGASPSVIRAAAMFTLSLFAKTISRQSGIYNILAASSFLLLCYNPNWLWDTGFQLSYAAVLSLCLFSRSIFRLFSFKSKMLKGIWEAASVSLAAQILTTPLSIFYFHRFPAYFLPANLLAVPLSSAALLGGVALCLLYWLPFMGHILGWWLGLLIRFLNCFILHVSGMPGAVIPGSLPLLQLIIIYFVIFCCCQFVLKKEKCWIFASLLAICLFLSVRFLYPLSP